jgi:hypothetical protein
VYLNQVQCPSLDHASRHANAPPLGEAYHDSVDDAIDQVATECGRVEAMLNALSASTKPATANAPERPDGQHPATWYLAEAHKALKVFAQDALTIEARTSSVACSWQHVTRSSLYSTCRPVLCRTCCRSIKVWRHTTTGNKLHS